MSVASGKASDEGSSCSLSTRGGRDGPVEKEIRYGIWDRDRR